MSLRFRTSALLKRFEKTFDTHNRIEVSGSALRHNLQIYARRSGLAVFPVLKGNAYGHGIEQVVQALEPEHVPYIAVDGYFEALRIRNISKQPILVMGAIKTTNFSKLRYDKMAFVVQDIETIQALGKTGKHIKVHLEVNSGMNRYGVSPAHVANLAKAVLAYKNLELEGVMTHLADSDGDDPQTVQAAGVIFDKAVRAVHKAGATPVWLHIAQTAGSVVVTSRYANAMRLGLGLYGIDPFPATSGLSTPELRPALKLISTITKVNKLQPGDKVSYNYTYAASKAMAMGVLPLGYYEGVNRELSNSGCVADGETYLPIIGRVCMNHTMIDLSATSAAVGDEVIVYSNIATDQNSISSIAKQHGLFAYNMLTALSPDVRRLLVA